MTTMETFSALFHKSCLPPVLMANITSLSGRVSLVATAHSFGKTMVTKLIQPTQMETYSFSRTGPRLLANLQRIQCQQATELQVPPSALKCRTEQHRHIH